MKGIVVTFLLLAVLVCLATAQRQSRDGYSRRQESEDYETFFYNMPDDRPKNVQQQPAKRNANKGDNAEVEKYYSAIADDDDTATLASTTDEKASNTPSSNKGAPMVFTPGAVALTVLLSVCSVVFFVFLVSGIVAAIIYQRQQTPVITEPSAYHSLGNNEISSNTQ